jgi:hypothetical protein
MHTTYVHNGFLILAFVFFLLDGFRVQSNKVTWTPLGFACVVGSFLFPFFV